MEISENFVDCFEIDLTSHVLSFLNDPADLVRASAVSHSWRHFVIANGFCKKLWLRKFPHVAHIAYAVEKSDGIIRLSDVTSVNAANCGALEREHKIFSSLLQPLAKPIVSSKECLSFPIDASSTHDIVENVMNTLIPVDRYQGGFSCWSSKGQIDPDVPEYILYKLTSGIGIVTEVNIRPFEAFWEPGNPVYSPMSVRFRLGYPKSITNLEMDVCPVEHPSADKYVWTYTSPEFPMAQEACLQQFKLPEPVVCIGGIFQIELLGRAQKNESDGLFYICLGYIKVLGHPLEPAYMLEMFQSGELQLKYYPDAIDSVLQSFCGESSTPVEDEAHQQQSIESLAYQMVERVLIEEDEFWLWSYSVTDSVVLFTG